MEDTQDLPRGDSNDEEFALVGAQRVVECADPAVGLSEVQSIAPGVVTGRSVERLAMGVDGESLEEAALSCFKTQRSFFDLFPLFQYAEHGRSDRDDLTTVQLASENGQCLCTRYGDAQSCIRGGVSCHWDLDRGVAG